MGAQGVNIVAVLDERQDPESISRRLSGEEATSDLRRIGGHWPMQLTKAGPEILGSGRFGGIRRAFGQPRPGFTGVLGD